MRILRHTPTVRDFHWHQQGIARPQTHALTADFGDEFSTQDVNPLILFVMQVKRRAAICMVLPYGKYINCKPPVRVGGTNHLG
jgi:hypothetical protein